MVTTVCRVPTAAFAAGPIRGRVGAPPVRADAPMPRRPAVWGQRRQRTLKQVTHPSSFSNSLMSTAVTR